MTFAIVPAAGLETPSKAPAAGATAIWSDGRDVNENSVSLKAAVAALACILVSELVLSGLILLGLLLGALRLITIGCGPPI